MSMTLSLGLTKDRAIRVLLDFLFFFLFASITKKPWYSTLLGISYLPEHIFYFSVELKWHKLTLKHPRWPSGWSKYVFPKETSIKHFCFKKFKPNLPSAPVSTTITPKVNTWFKQIFALHLQCSTISYKDFLCSWFKLDSICSMHVIKFNILIDIFVIIAPVSTNNMQSIWSTSALIINSSDWISIRVCETDPIFDVLLFGLLSRASFSGTWNTSTTLGGKCLWFPFNKP